jgi:serine/threonine protein kinase
MTGRDFIYLIDFGIAHNLAATRVTKTGTIIGTLAYMAPERFTDGVADARADVYSLACLLNECLTDAQPYPCDIAEQQITAHLTLSPPKPSKLNSARPCRLRRGHRSWHGKTASRSFRLSRRTRQGSERGGIVCPSTNGVRFRPPKARGYP